MMRKLVVGLAAAAAITAGSIVDASARGGGGHGGMGGGGHGGMGGGGRGGMAMGHGGMGMGHGVGIAHAGFAHPGNLGRFSGVHHFDRDRHFGRFADRDRFRHRFRHRVAFVGGFPYAYYDDCLTRVWTRWGWRWVSLCY
jgi:hypothetical protein